MNEHLKESILTYTRAAGCDFDGDIITVGGIRYYVHILSGTVKKI